MIAGAGIVAGVVGGLVLARFAGGLRRRRATCPGPCRRWAPRRVLVAAAVLASLMPAARASRVDVMQALRTD